MAFLWQKTTIAQGLGILERTKEQSEWGKGFGRLHLENRIYALL